MSEPTTDTTAQPICSEPGCTRGAKVRGMCQLHYAKFRAAAKEDGTWDSLPRPRRGVCSVEGCTKPTEARGLCLRHYQKARKLAVEDGTWVPIVRESK